MIFLCAWVTARPDVCNKWETLFQHKLYKTRMGLMSLMLVSPEVVVIRAFDQWTAVCYAIATSRSFYSVVIQYALMRLRQIYKNSTDGDVWHDGEDGQNY